MVNWSVFLTVLGVIAVIVGLISGIATIFALITKQGKLTVILTCSTIICVLVAALLVAYTPQHSLLASNNARPNPTPTITPTTKPKPFYPYTAAAPGPVCDTGGVVWLQGALSPSTGLQCFPDHVHMVSQKQCYESGCIYSASFQLQPSVQPVPFPSNFSISFQVSNVSEGAEFGSDMWTSCNCNLKAYVTSIRGSSMYLGNTYLITECSPDCPGAATKKVPMNLSLPHTYKFIMNSPSFMIALDNQVIFSDNASAQLALYHLDITLNSYISPESVDITSFQILPL